jgi:hypothetical protein
MRNKITDVRNLLIEAMEKVNDGEMDINHAKAMAAIGQVLVNSAKVEVDFLKISKSEGSGFLVEGTKGNHDQKLLK